MTPVADALAKRLQAEIDEIIHTPLIPGNTVDLDFIRWLREDYRGRCAAAHQRLGEAKWR